MIEPHSLHSGASSVMGAKGSFCWGGRLGQHCPAKSSTEGSTLEAMARGDIQYVSDETGTPVGVIVPIELWREIESERETAYLLRSAAMRQRLTEAKNRQGGLSLEEACEKLGV